MIRAKSIIVGALISASAVAIAVTSGLSDAGPTDTGGAGTGSAKSGPPISSSREAQFLATYCKPNA